MEPLVLYFRIVHLLDKASSLKANLQTLISFIDSKRWSCSVLGVFLEQNLGSQSPTKYDMGKKILPRNHQMSILELLILENLSLELKVFTQPFWRKLTLKLSSIFEFTIVFWPSQGTMVEILGEACWTFWGCKSIFWH